jgi:DnaJ-class molecular chaperone
MQPTVTDGGDPKCPRCDGTGECRSPFCTTRLKRPHLCAYCSGKGTRKDLR